MYCAGCRACHALGTGLPIVMEAQPNLGGLMVPAHEGLGR